MAEPCAECLEKGAAIMRGVLVIAAGVVVGLVAAGLISRML